MSNDDIICIHCNEIFLNMYQYGGHKGKCANRKRAMEYEYIEDFIVDNEDLDYVNEENNLVAENNDAGELDFADIEFHEIFDRKISEYIEHQQRYLNNDVLQFLQAGYTKPYMV